MPVSSVAVALSTTAAVVFTPTRERQTVRITNGDASIVIYVGGPGVTSSTGTALAAGASITLEGLNVGDIVYAVAASGTPSARVLTQGA